MSQDNFPTTRRGFLSGMSAAAGATIMQERARATLVEPPSETPYQETDQTSVNKDVMVEMRDGKKLATDVYLPKGENVSKPFPTLVTRTPYDKEGYDDIGNYYAKHGYATVVQDVRGKFNSPGEFYPYRSEGFAENKDGYDTVEWAATRNWSNGKVGTFGISYLAGTQWALAHNDQLPPHLEAMAPGFAVASYYGQGAYAGGANLLSHNLDYLFGFAVEEFDRENPDQADAHTFVDQAQEAMPQLYWDLPAQPFEPLIEAGTADWLNGWQGHEVYDDYWRAQDHTRHYEKIDVPVLNYGGWYDIFDQGTVWNFQGVREEATSEAQQQTALVMGPYTHGDTELQAQGQVMGHAHEFPENATYNYDLLALAWFERHLKDKNIQSLPPVRLYVPGLDKWIGAQNFPLSDTQFTNYYLHSDGNANASEISHNNPTYNGDLARDKPERQPPDTYTYDPADPVVTLGGYNTHWNGGVADRSTVYHDRDDILVYQTPPLKQDVAVVGPITATLYASTSAVDTDFVVHLSDVDPTDRTGGLWVAEGARRGRIGNVSADPRNTNTYSEVSLLEPGKVYEWKIAVWPTARVFQQGHRIRIDITSSDFPRYNRNLNTGEGLSGREMETAEQTIYHDQSRPSRVELPIVPMQKLEQLTIDGPIPE